MSMKCRVLQLVSALVLLVALPVSANTITTTNTVVVPSTMPSSVLIQSGNGSLAFGATVTRVEPDEVVVSVGGSLLRVPMREARFESAGLDVDPTSLYRGMPVTVVMPSLRGTVTALRGNVLVLSTADGLVELPAEALNSDALAYCTVQVRDANGNLQFLPVADALDLQTRGGAVLAIGTLPATTTVTVGVPVAVDRAIVTRDGTIVGINNEVVTFRMADGTITSIPIIALSNDFMLHRMVYVRMSNGQLVRVPVRSAITLQNKGAVVIESPTQTIAVPPYP